MNPFSVVSSPNRGGIALPRTTKDDSTDSYEFGHQEEEPGLCNKRYLFRLVGLMVTVGLLGIGLKIVPIEEMLQKKHLKESAIESVVTDSKFQQSNSLNDATASNTNIQNNDISSTTKGTVINKETEALDESSSSSSKTTNKKSSKSDSSLSSSSKSDSSSSSSSKDSSKESKNNNKSKTTSPSSDTTSSTTATSSTSTSSSTTPTTLSTPFTGNNVVGIMPAYKDASNSIDVRIQDLLSRMTLEEKTMQMVTLYGYKRVLEDRLPTR